MCKWNYFALVCPFRKLFVFVWTRLIDPTAVWIKQQKKDSNENITIKSKPAGEKKKKLIYSIE